jgi:outer membrane receptor protein involved in Fe transport
MLDVGPRMFSQEADTFRYVFGASGTLDRLGADWEAYHTRQEFSSTQLTENYINMLNVQNAFETELGAGVAVNGVQYRCKDAVARRLGCVPLNMFGPNSITTEAADYIRFNQLNRTGTIYQGYTANLSNITLFEMPAGAVLAAVGFEKSDLQGDEKVDALTASGGSSGNPRLSTSGSYDSTDYYAEFSAPLIADVTGFQELNLDYAYRHTSYSSFASESVDRVAIKWKPISDVTIRATSSTSYKAPTISNLYFGGGGGFPTYNDPCEANYLATRSAAEQATAAVQCAAEGLDSSTWATSNNQILSLTVGNPNLTPEEGENTTLGIVWEPTNISFLEDIGFSMAVDTFELEIANAVTSSGSQGTLNRCYLQGSAEDCSRVRRSYGGDVNSAQTSNINTSSADRYKGVDFSVNFTFDELPSIGGAFEVDIIGTHFKENVTVDASGVSDDYVGQCFDFGESCFNRDRVNFSFRWYKHDWRVGLNTRYLSGIDMTPAAREYFAESPYGDPLPAGWQNEVEDIYSVDDYTYSNLNIAYMATDHLNVSLSNKLATDKDTFKWSVAM